MAEKTGYHLNSIKGYEKEDRLPPFHYVVCLAKETDTSLLGLLEYLFSASKPSDSSYDIEICDLLNNTENKNLDSLTTDSKDNTLVISSDSMEPTIRKGATVSYSPGANLKDIKESMVLLIDFDGQTSARRIQRLPNGKVLLVCDNPKYSDIKMSNSDFEKAKIIGVANSVTNAL